MICFIHEKDKSLRLIQTRIFYFFFGMNSFIIPIIALAIAPTIIANDSGLVSIETFFVADFFDLAIVNYPPLFFLFIS